MNRKKFLVPIAIIFTILIFIMMYRVSFANDSDTVNPNNGDTILNMSGLEGKTNIKYVSNWQEFETAINDSTINYIKLTQDISYTGSSIYNITLTYNNNRLRTMIIDGGGYNIDLKGYARLSLDGTGSIVKDRDIFVGFQNINIKNAPYYGIFTAYGVSTVNNSTASNLGSGTVAYENVNYDTVQVQYSQGFDTIINKNVNINIMASPITSTDAGYFQTSKLDIKPGATLNYNPQITTSQPALSFVSGITKDTGITIGEGATFNINPTGRLQSTPLINFDSTGYSKIHYIQLAKGAKMNIDTSNVDMTNQIGTFNMITMRDNDKVDIGEQASLKINSSLFNTTSGDTNNILSMGANSLVHINQQGVLDFEIMYQNSANTSSKSLIMQGSSSQFNADKDSIVNLRTNMTSSSGYILNLGSSSQINLDNTKLTNLESNVSTTLSPSGNSYNSSYIINSMSNNISITINNQSIDALNNARYSRGGSGVAMSNIPGGVAYDSYDKPNWGSLSWKGLSTISIPATSSLTTGTDIGSSNVNMSVTGNDEQVKSSFIANFNPVMYSKLTFTQLDTTQSSKNSVDVTTFDEFVKAMINVSVTEINIKNDLIAGDTSSMETRVMTPVKGFKINGNGKSIELKGMNFFNDINIPANMNRRIEFNNLNMYGQCYFGLFDSWGSVTPGGQADFLYDNITYTGSQLTSSLYQDINFSGNVTVNTLPSYISPLDGKTYISQGNGQENIEGRNVKFLDGVKYYGTANSNDVIHLNSGGNVVGGIMLGDNSDVTLKTLATNSDNSSPVTGSGSSSEVIYMPGNLTTGKNAKLKLYTRPDKAQMAINMVGDTSNVYLDKSSSLDIRLSDTGLAPGFSSDVGTSDNAPIINMSSKANLSVQDDAELSITGTYNRTRNSVIFSNNSQFNINSKGSFLVNLSGQFKGDRLYNQILSLGSGSTFVSIDPTCVDINTQNISNSSKSVDLIAINGSSSDGSNSNSLVAQNVEISAWNNDNRKPNPNNIWESVYRLKSTYNGSNVTTNTAVGGSKLNLNINSLFHTENFNRILFKRYPDVQITLNSLYANSKSLSGSNSPDTYINFVGDSSIPLSTVSLPSSNTSNLRNNKYNLYADANTSGYNYNLPTGKMLTKGNTVIATGFSELSGKSTTVTQVVGEELKPILKISKVADLDFGNIDITDHNDLTNNNFQTINNQTSEITAVNIDYWQLSASISDFIHTDDSNKKLKYAIKYNNSLYNVNTPIVLLDSNDGSSLFNKTPNEGLKLNISNNQKLYIGEYNATVTWTLANGPD